MDTSYCKPQINGMTIANVKDIEDVERQCFSQPWSLDSLVQELSNPHAVYRTACLDGKTAGYAGMHHIIDEGYITNIAVLPSYRRRGIAKALLDDMLEYAGKNGLSMLTLEVRENNAAARYLYESYGFKNVGRRKNFYQSPTEDGIIMTRELNQE